MSVDRKLAKQLAGTADIVNTVNGGTVYPTFETTKEDDHYRLEVIVPTVHPEDIKVEVSGSDLLVFQTIKSERMNLPNLLGIIRMTPDVHVDEISAEYEEDVLTVFLPYTEMPGGLNREIKIHRPF